MTSSSELPNPSAPSAPSAADGGRGVDAGARGVRAAEEAALRAIAAAAAPGPGSAAFFEELVRQLGTALDVRWAWIGETVGEPPAAVRTLAHWAHGALQPGITYALDHTPCRRAMETREGLHVGAGVQRAFPRSHALVEMGAESYWGVALHDADGVPRGMLTIIHDRTLERTPARESLVRTCAARAEGELARRRAEERLAAREDQLATAQRIARLGGWTWDPRTGDTTWSDEQYRLIGYAPGEVPAEFARFCERVHPDDLEGLTRTITGSIRAKAPGWTHEFRLRLPDGTVRHVVGRGEIRYGPDGEAVRVDGTDQDVTEQRLLERQLQHARKMDAVGRLAGGIAHDFNNLLTVITGTVELIRDDLGDGHASHGDVDRIAEAADRARALVRQLLAFGRRQELQLRPLDLNDVVRAALPLLARSAGEGVAVRAETGPSPVVVRADPAQLEQALATLAANARDAGAGALVLRVGAVERDGRARAAIEVADTGRGIAAEHLGSLFEPFFTTKPFGEGAGLGLAMVYGIVSQLGGEIAVQSAEGEGTTFTLLLPLAAPGPVAGEGAAHRPEAPSAAARPAVLLVEDEPQVRATVRRLLERLGYAVHEAADGADALSRWRWLRDEVCLVLTDVRMPRMGGHELARRLREDAPSIPIVFMSGYSDERHDEDATARTAFLEKPVPMPRLAETLRALVEA